MGRSGHGEARRLLPYVRTSVGRRSRHRGGQIFQLGDKYSRAMGATFMDEDGEEKPFIMGCYGVGISRTLAAIVEQHNDEHGIMWPLSVAPAHICVVPLTVGDSEVQPMAEKIAKDLPSSASRWSSTTVTSAPA